MRHVFIFILVIIAIDSQAQFKIGFGSVSQYQNYEKRFINTSKSIATEDNVHYHSELFVPLGKNFLFAAQNASYDESIMIHFDYIFEELDLGALGTAAVVINRTDLMVKRNLLKKKFFSFDIFMGPSIIEATNKYEPFLGTSSQVPNYNGYESAGEWKYKNFPGTQVGASAGFALHLRLWKFLISYDLQGTYGHRNHQELIAPYKYNGVRMDAIVRTTGTSILRVLSIGFDFYYDDKKDKGKKKTIFTL